jgi:hypothetical protein
VLLPGFQKGRDIKASYVILINFKPYGHGDNKVPVAGQLSAGELNN